MGKEDMQCALGAAPFGFFKNIEFYNEGNIAAGMFTASKEIGKKEEDVYSEEGREKLVEDDQISPSEEAFSEGAEQKGELSTCAQCGNVLDEDNTIEREVNGEIKWFCCEDCAKKYKEEKVQKKPEEI